MTPTAEIWFLRTGRTRRGRGYLIETDPTTKAVKLNARAPFRQPVWISPGEIEAGKKAGLTPVR